MPGQNGARRMPPICSAGAGEPDEQSHRVAPAAFGQS
jgi:hypothetical protein